MKGEAALVPSAEGASGGLQVAVERRLSSVPAVADAQLSRSDVKEVKEGRLRRGAPS